MSINIETARVVAFARDITHLAEQKMSRFRGSVSVESLLTGKREFFDQVGAVTATKFASRHADTPQFDTPHFRRALDPAFFAHADLIDDPDKLRVLNNPNNAYATAFGRAFARAMDDEVVSAAFATAVTGEEGGSTAAFDTSGFQISTAGGLTLAKIIDASKKLRAAENDPDEGFHLAVSQEQMEDVLNDSTITSADFNSVRALMTGDLKAFMGFGWIPSERLGVDGSSRRRCIAWATNSLKLGVLKEPATRVTERDDKNFSTQIYMSMDIGATRMDETGVVELLCTE